MASLDEMSVDATVKISLSPRPRPWYQPRPGCGRLPLLPRPDHRATYTQVWVKDPHEAHETRQHGARYAGHDLETALHCIIYFSTQTSYKYSTNIPWSSHKFLAVRALSV